ncbi:unnamed protein product [Pedinophyceae sp. YPF-701]|nr:unnamed protein product [Pedinophyceae sp. YPF-701]
MSKFIAMILVSGAQTLARAFIQAYGQALHNARRSGMNAENVKRAAVRSKMTLEEARQILEIDAGATAEQVEERFRHLYRVNKESGTFYLLSKVYRAKERVDQEEGRETVDPRAEEAQAGEGEAGGGEEGGARARKGDGEGGG